MEEFEIDLADGEEVTAETLEELSDNRGEEPHEQ